MIDFTHYKTKIDPGKRPEIIFNRKKIFNNNQSNNESAFDCLHYLRAESPRTIGASLCWHNGIVDGKFLKNIKLCNGKCKYYETNK